MTRIPAYPSSNKCLLNEEDKLSRLNMALNTDFAVFTKKLTEEYCGSHSPEELALLIARTGSGDIKLSSQILDKYSFAARRHERNKIDSIRNLSEGLGVSSTENNSPTNTMVVLSKDDVAKLHGRFKNLTGQELATEVEKFDSERRESNTQRFVTEHAAITDRIKNAADNLHDTWERAATTEKVGRNGDAQHK